MNTTVRRLFLITFVILIYSAPVQPQRARNSGKPPAPELRNDSPACHHPVRTKNPEGQRLFDEGLTLIYAFDYRGAATSFAGAATLDPKMAMAYWGIAYALGSDYYYGTAGDSTREREAYEALKKALRLSSDGPEAERAYVAALSKRYCNCPNPNRAEQAVAFKDGMRELAKSYPDDLDAAALYAQSIMNLSPWALWNPDGTPWGGTPEIVSVLESVLKRDPRHLGALHYYFHTVEGSPHPERALPYVNLLPSLAPSIGHIVHMPAHIYIRTGEYLTAEEACLKAARIDESRIQTVSKPGMFAILSYLHDLYFLAAAASMDGHYGNARKAAAELVAQVAPHVEEIPELEAFLTVEPAVLVRFDRWEEILKLPNPRPKLAVANAVLSFARGMALAATGKVTEAESERRQLASALERTSPQEAFLMSPNSSREVLEIASSVLAAKLLAASNQRSEAIAEWRHAVLLQDGLKYAEPPSWFYPVRESLGAALFLAGQFQEAEQVFREDLERNPRNPRSLFGLSETLRSQGRSYDAGIVRTRFDAAWKSDSRRLDLHNF